MFQSTEEADERRSEDKELKEIESQRRIRVPSQLEHHGTQVSLLLELGDDSSSELCERERRRGGQVDVAPASSSPSS